MVVMMLMIPLNDDNGDELDNSPKKPKWNTQWSVTVVRYKAEYVKIDELGPFNLYWSRKYNFLLKLA